MRENTPPRIQEIEEDENGEFFFANEELEEAEGDADFEEGRMAIFLWLTFALTLTHHTSGFGVARLRRRGGLCI